MTIGQVKAARRKTKADPRWRNKLRAANEKATKIKAEAKAAK